MALTALLVNVVMFGSIANAWVFPKLPPRKKTFISFVKIASRRKKIRRSQRFLSSSRSAHPHRRRHPVLRPLSPNLWPLKYPGRTRVGHPVKVRRSTGRNFTNLHRQHCQSLPHPVCIPHKMVLSITTIPHSQATHLLVQRIQLVSNLVRPRLVRNILQTQLCIGATLLYQVILSHRPVLPRTLVKIMLMEAMAHQLQVTLSPMARHNKTTIQRRGHSI
jgi:hypothetical protein